MLDVLTPEEVLNLLKKEFSPSGMTEKVSLREAPGRVLSEDILADEYVPDFNRSTVDGYALKASDTFGCSDAIPAILPLHGEVFMGQAADFTLPTGECCYVPTGGAVPEGADCVVMIEYSEDFGDGTIGISKAGAPGLNMIFRGDDVFPGKKILEKGRVLNASDIGALAAIGCCCVPVTAKIKIGILSTGDELVPPEEKPEAGQVRDVNSPLLEALFQGPCTEVRNYGIVVDNEELLCEKMTKAVAECDMVLVSGGSSVGVKDASCRTIESLGTLLMHGIAIKPGKPTILGKAGNKPIFGLPGHPVAAFTVAKLFAMPALHILCGARVNRYTVPAVMSESVGANHGRAQVGSVKLQRDGDRLTAIPIRTKSGLITNLAGADGLYEIARDCEGLEKNAEVEIDVF